VVSADVGSTVNVWDEQRGQMREVTDDDGLGSTVCVWEADTGKLITILDTLLLLVLINHYYDTVKSYLLSTQTSCTLK
jgi:hypothetical protein